MNDAETNDVTKLMEDAQIQLNDHSVWLMKEINALYADNNMNAAKAALVHQCTQVKLRMVRHEGTRVSIVWEYPDELAAFLRAPTTPAHLRATITDGYIVNPEQPAHTAKRVR